MSDTMIDISQFDLPEVPFNPVARKMITIEGVVVDLLDMGGIIMDACNNKYLYPYEDFRKGNDRNNPTSILAPIGFFPQIDDLVRFHVETRPLNETGMLGFTDPMEDISSGLTICWGVKAIVFETNAQASKIIHNRLIR